MLSKSHIMFTVWGCHGSTVPTAHLHEFCQYVLISGKIASYLKDSRCGVAASQRGRLKSSRIVWQIIKILEHFNELRQCDMRTEGGENQWIFLIHLQLDMDQIAQSAAPSSHLGRDKELQWCSFLFPAFSNHICHSRGAVSARRDCVLSGDGRFWSTERIPLGFTVCDMGLTVIFSTVTPPHERCPCVTLGD